MCMHVYINVDIYTYIYIYTYDIYTIGNLKQLVDSARWDFGMPKELFQSLLLSLSQAPLQQNRNWMVTAEHGFGDSRKGLRPGRKFQT